MARCEECGKRRVIVSDGLCKQCLGAFYAGAQCSRCDLDLDSEGYCPNDRCPFRNTHQDESNGDWEPPDDEEQNYIERVVKRRRKRR
jgi:hypothetical protein